MFSKDTLEGVVIGCLLGKLVQVLFDQYSHKHKEKFSLRYKTEVQAVGEIYPTIREVYNQVCKYGSHNGNTVENREKFKESIANLNGNLSRHRISIRHNLVSKIDILKFDLERIVQDIDSEGERYNSSSMYSRIYTQASEAFSEITDDFRMIRGEKTERTIALLPILLIIISFISGCFYGSNHVRILDETASKQLSADYAEIRNKFISED